MIDQKSIAQTLDSILDRSSALDMLLDFENVFDTLHIYAYRNWDLGEVVEGPTITKYWVEVILMYPAKKMPDPVAAKRLTRHGCRVEFKKEDYVRPGPVDAEEIGVPSKKKAIHTDVFLVKISMPRHFINDFQSKKLVVNNVDVDLEDVNDAYDDGLDQESSMKNTEEEDNKE